MVSPVVGRIADRRGPAPILTVGGIAGALGVGLHLLLTDLEPDLVLGILAPGLLIGISGGCSFAMLVTATMRDVPPQRFGMGGAGRTTVFQLSIALGIAVSAAVVGDPDNAVDALANNRINWTIMLAFFLAQAALFATAYPASRPQSG